MSSSCYVSDLFFYPVKSCKGIRLDRAVLDEFGICHDRRFMFVDDNHKFITQRSHPQLSQLQASLKLSPNNSILTLIISSDEVGELVFELQEFECAVNGLSKVVVWNDTVSAYILKNQYTQRISEFLNTNVSLAYMPESTFRQVDREYFSEDKRVSFADGYPFLLTSEASLKDLNSKLLQPVPMTNFRPNIVISGGISAFSEDNWSRIFIGDIVFELVKPCSRCVMTTINLKGEKSSNKEPLITLGQYRKNNFGICFGQNLIHLSEGVVRKGDLVSFE